MTYEASIRPRCALNEGGGLALSTGTQNPTNEGDNINWYSEYITRNAPATIQWLQQPTEHSQNSGLWGSQSQEIKGLGLQRSSAYGVSHRVIAPLDDGSVCVWDYSQYVPREQIASRGRILGRSRPGSLFPDMDHRTCTGQDSSTALDAGSLVSVDPLRKRAYIGVGNCLNEVDLAALNVISQQIYSSSIYALSEQDLDYDSPVTVATKADLYIYDPRCSTSSSGQNYTQDVVDSSVTFSPLDKRLTSPFSPRGCGSASLPRQIAVSILHPPLPNINSIFVAGRFPSILQYDRRFFPRLQDVAHSGARLSSLTVVPGVFHSDLQERQDLRNHHSLIAAGEYNGKGSLEVYPLSATSSMSDLEDADPATIENGNTYHNRQSASSSKILSVATHGAKIVYSDGDGNIRWVERDARAPVRSWNINVDRPLPNPRSNGPHGSNRGNNDGYRSGVREEQGEIARKLIPSGGTLNEDEVLIWTGERLGSVGFYPRPHYYAEEDDDDLCEDEDKLREREYMEGMEYTMQAQIDNIHLVRSMHLGTRG